jgi:O-antigen/teichoic acid export membrane protein
MSQQRDDSRGHRRSKHAFDRIWRSSLVRHITTFGLARVLGLALGVIATALVSRRLGPANYAAFALAMTLININNLVTDFGLSPLLVREVNSPGGEATITTVAVLRSVIGTVAGLISLAIAFLIAHSMSAFLCCAIILSLSPTAGLTTGLSVAQARSQFRAYSLLTVAQSLSWTAIAITLYFMTKSLTLWAVGFTLAAGLTAAAVHTHYRRTNLDRAEFSRSTARKLISESVFVAGASLFVLAYHRIDYLIVYRLEPAVTAGQYAAASRMLSQGLLVTAIVVTVLVPRFASQVGEGKEEALWLRRCLQLAAAFGVLVMVGFLSLSRSLVILAFGGQFVPASNMLMELAVSMPFMSVGLMALEAHVILRRVHRQLVLALVVLTVNVIATVWGLKAFGINGAIAATDVTEALAATLFTISAFQSIQVPSDR